MAEIKIARIREVPRLVKPGVVETYVVVNYEVDGYFGVLELPKKIATRDEIIRRIKLEIPKIPLKPGEVVEG